MIREYNYLFKVVIIGNSSVGKSSILRRFADDSFQESYLATIGVDFRFKSVSVNGEVAKLQIWDTAGQQRFRTITGAYYKGAHAIVLVYDLTKEDSFRDIEQFWLPEVQKYAIPNVQLFIMANKVDAQEQRRVISKQVAQKFCMTRNLVFSEVSAKTGEGVAETFHKVAETIIKVNPQEEIKNATNSKIEEIHKKKQQLLLQSPNKPKKQKKCC